MMSIQLACGQRAHGSVSRWFDKDFHSKPISVQPISLHLPAARWSN